MMYKYSDWVGKWATYTPDKIAVSEYFTGNSVTYKQLNNVADNIACYLTKNLELKAGDRIAVLAEYSINYFYLFSAAQKTGIILVPLNYRLSGDELDVILKKCTPRLTVIEKQFTQLISDKSSYRKLTFRWLMSEVDQISVEKNTVIDWSEITPESPLFIIYTSGTTGEPKGVIYTHGMAFWNSLNTGLRLNITSNDHTVNCMPSFHTGGWNVFITPFLHHGASFTLINKFEADQVLEALDQTNSTIFMGVPTMLKMMADAPQFKDIELSKLRYMVVGGEAMPVPLIEKYKTKNILIRQGYGLTEAGPNITSLADEFVISKKGSIGTPYFYVETKIDYKEDDSTSGELLLKGPIVTPGYWNDTENTAAAIKQGWLHTGDVVKVDKDGFLFIVDRIKNMYISGGENVYPLEVEKCLIENKSIAEVAIIGVKDEKWGEVGKAFVVCKNNKPTNENELVTFLTSKIAKYKIPKHFVFIKELPKSDTGKIDRKQLKLL